MKRMILATLLLTGCASPLSNIHTFNMSNRASVQKACESPHANGCTYLRLKDGTLKEGTIYYVDNVGLAHEQCHVRAAVDKHEDNCHAREQQDKIQTWIRGF